MHLTNSNQKSLPQVGEGFLCGGDEWNRTIDTRIFSPLLYQLSYITVTLVLNVGAKVGATGIHCKC